VRANEGSRPPPVGECAGVVEVVRDIRVGQRNLFLERVTQVKRAADRQRHRQSCCASRARRMLGLDTLALSRARPADVQKDERFALGHDAADRQQARFLPGPETHLLTIEKDPLDPVAGDHRTPFIVGGR
jgi:hypothetical protein